MDNPFAILQDEISQLKSMVSKLLSAFEKQDEDNKERFISPAECRALFYPAISKSTLYRWTKEGLIKQHLTPGKKPVYKKSEVEAAVKTLKTYSHKKTPRMEMQEV